MTNNTLKKLIDALASIGYEISELDDHYNRNTEHYRGDIKILIYPISEPKTSFSKELFIKLVEIFFSLGYGIIEFNLGYKKVLGDIILVLQTT